MDVLAGLADVFMRLPSKEMLVQWLLGQITSAAGLSEEDARLIGAALGGLLAIVAAYRIVAALRRFAARLKERRRRSKGDRKPSGTGGPRTPRERLDEFKTRLKDAPPARSAQEAMDQVSKTLDDVEDEFSGIPKKVPPPAPDMPDGRMYPPLPDHIKTLPDGSLQARTRGHTVLAKPDGSVTITNVKTGEVEFTKPGGR